MGLLDLFSSTKANEIPYAKIINAMEKHFSGQPGWIAQNNQSYIDNGFFMNDHVYSIIRLLTRAASTIPIYLYKVVDKKVPCFL